MKALRYLRYLVLALLCLALVMVAMANRDVGRGAAAAGRAVATLPGCNGPPRCRCSW